MTASFPHGFDPVQLAAASGAQQRALRPGASVWVSASAGSGKTEMLTRRLLALLLADPALQPRQILALTFTKAGAAEMAARLPRHLARLAALSDDELVATVQDELGEAATGLDVAGLPARVRTLAQDVLVAPPLVSTIHGLAQQLLVRFAHAAGLPDDFSVFEEGEQARLLRDIQHHLLQHAQGPLADSLATLLDELGEHGWRELSTLLVMNWRRFEDLLEDGGAAAVLARLDAALGLKGNEGWALGEIQILDDELAALRAVAGVLPEHEAAQVLRAVDQAAAWREFLLTDKDTARVRLFNKKELAVAGDGVEEVFRTAQVRVAEQVRLRKVLRGRQLTEDLLLWCASVRAIYAQKKRELGTLDYGDLLDALERLLQRADDGLAERVWYALDRRFMHLVLDEGQDNNPQQNRIVLWLAKSILSGDVGGDAPRTVMAVGDVKQSIFRFQGAVPGLFVDLRDTLQNWSGESFSAVDIAHSFRSGKHILAAVDAVLGQPEIAQAVMGQPLDWLPHRAVALARPSRVEFWPLVEAPEQAEVEPWALPQVRFEASGHSAEIVCFRQLGAWLQEQVRRGVVMPSTGKPLRYDDVMLVVQRNRMGALAAGVLRGMGIAVAAAGVLQQPVRDVVCLLRVVFNPQDRVALCAVLKAFKGWDDARILELAAREWVLPEAEAVWLGGFDSGDALGIVMRAMRELGAEAGMFDTLLDWAEQAESLAALVARLEQEDLPAAAGTRGVRILTVHGSKGLEAPLVILADTTARMGDVAREKILWGGNTLLYRQGKGISSFEDGLAAAESERLRADSLRGLYVAMTRARDWLVVTGFAGNRHEARGTRTRGNRVSLRGTDNTVPSADGGPCGGKEAGEGKVSAARLHECWYGLVEQAAGAWENGILGEEFEALGRAEEAAVEPEVPDWLRAPVALPLVGGERE